MRETVRSLRIYLGISGTLSFLVGGTQLLSGRLPLWLSALLLCGLFASAGLLYLAFQLRSILRDDLDRGLLIVHANLVYSAACLMVVLRTVGPGMAVGQIAIGIMILVYIRQNMRRLSAEAVATLAETPAPDSATA